MIHTRPFSELAPPSIEDAQTAPTAAQLLPQVLTLTPRGQAWGTDEAGSAAGVSPVMAMFWTAVSSWIAAENVRESGVMAQGFSTGVTWSLSDWETELGLPPAGEDLMPTTPARSAVVAMTARGVATVSPYEMIALAAAGGANIEIEEPDQFQVDFTELVAMDAPSSDIAPLAEVDVWPFWIVQVISPGPLGTTDRVIRALAPFAPAHTRLVAAV